MKRVLKRKEKKQNIKKVIQVIIIVILIILLSSTAYEIYKENKIKFLNISQTEKENNSANLLSYKATNTEENNKNTENDTNANINTNTESKENSEKNAKQIVPTKYQGYEVSAKLEIPKINLSTNILSYFSMEGLKLCASKYFGPEPNEVGNFCIVGHNYKKENMFSNLKELEKGDEIYLIDNKNGKNKYEIYDIYKVSPDNTNPLNQNTSNKKEITLITCTNYSNKRLIIKGREAK